MKNLKQIAFTLLAVITLMACQSERPVAELTEEEKKERAMKAMQLAQAGEEHEVLTSLEGKWRYKGHYRQGETGKKIAIDSGIAINRSIIDGRFLQSESHREGKEFMPIGVLMLGYDRAYEEYTAVLFGGGGTYYVTAKGGLEDSEPGVIRTSGHYDDPVLAEQLYDINILVENEDRYEVEIIFKDPETRTSMTSLTTEYVRMD